MYLYNVNIRNILLVCLIGLLGSFTASANGRNAFNMEQPSFTRHIALGSHMITIKGVVEDRSALARILPLDEQNIYNSFYPEYWTWIDPKNPLTLTLTFPRRGQQQYNLGLKEITHIRLEWINSPQSMVGGAWLIVGGVRDYKDQLMPVEIQVQVTDIFGGYLDLEEERLYRTPQEIEFAEKPGSDGVHVKFNDPHPRNLPPGRDVGAEVIAAAQRQFQKEPSEHFVTIITRLPELLSSSSAKDGHHLTIGSMSRFSLATSPNSTEFTSLETHDSSNFILTTLPETLPIVDGFEDSMVYVYLPAGPQIAAAIEKVLSQKVGPQDRTKALRIRGRPAKTNIRGLGMQDLGGIEKVPSLTIDTRNGTDAFPFFQFGDDVIVEVIDARPSGGEGNQCPSVFPKS